MTEPIDWVATESALTAWLNGVDGFGNVIFGDQRVPRQTYPYVSVLLMSSVRKGGRDDLVVSTDLTRALNILVTPVVQNNALYTITINSTPYNYTSGGAATAAQISAGLKSAIGSLSGFTITDNVGTLTILATAVFNITTTANLSWANLDNGHEVILQTVGIRKLTYQLTFMNNEANIRANGPNTTGMAYAEEAVATLSTEATIDLLLASGLAVVGNESPKKMDAVIDGEWLSIGVVDVSFNVGTVTTRDTGYIATVLVTPTVDGVQLPPVLL